MLSSAADNVMWLFDTAATTDTGESFVRISSSNSFWSLIESIFAWEIPDIKSVVPIKHRKQLCTKTKMRTGYQKILLKHEYSGRRC